MIEPHWVSARRAFSRHERTRASDQTGFRFDGRHATIVGCVSGLVFRVSARLSDSRHGQALHPQRTRRWDFHSGCLIAIRATFWGSSP